jgi:hypothetical protein
VSFHPLSDRLTRIDVDISVHPGSMIEKAARGMRHVKRAVRADLARFKAHVLMEDEESGAWRGQIEEGKVKRQRQSSSSGRRRSSSKRATSSRSRASSSRSRASSSNGSRSSSQRKKSGSKS